MGWIWCGFGMSSWVGAALLLGGCQQGPSLKTEQYVTRDGHEEQVGSACMSVEKGSGLGGGRAPGVPGAAGEGAADAGSSYSFSYEGTGSSVRLKVDDGSGMALADRSYDTAFIESGRRDELKVSAGAESLRFVAWGVPQCGQGK